MAASRVRLVGLFVASLFVGLMFARRAPDTYDARIMFEVAQNFVLHHSVHVHADYYGVNTPYSTYGLGMSALMAGLYELGRVVGLSPVAMAMTANPLLFAFLTVAVALLALRLGATWRKALLVAGVVVLATPLVAMTATGFSELGVALGLTVALIGVQRTQSEDSWRGPLVAGAGASLALIFRTDSAVLVVVPVLIGVLVASRRKRLAALGFGLAAAPLFAAWVAYNVIRFGAPWRLGYGHGLPFNHPALAGLFDLVFSPTHGLLEFTPILLIAAFGVRAAWRQAPMVTAVGAAALILRLVVFARWWGWYGGGGWGPRLLIPALPVLVLPLVALPVQPFRRHRTLAVVAGAIVAASVWVQVVGASVLTSQRKDDQLLAAIIPTSSGPAVIRFLTSPVGERRTDAVLMRPNLQPFTGLSRAFVQRRGMTDSVIGTEGDPATRLALVGLIVVATGVAVQAAAYSGPAARRD